MPNDYLQFMYGLMCVILKVHCIATHVTVSAKTVLNGTFIFKRKTYLKYSSCCGSVVLDFSHAIFTV